MRTLLGAVLFLSLLVPQLLEAKDPPPPAESFAAFWKEFRSAVAKNDRDAVAALSNLQHYHRNGQFSKEAFLQDYPSLFTRAARKCLATAKPVKETGRDTYSAICGEEIFSFEKVNGAYKFTDIGMND